MASKGGKKAPQKGAGKKNWMKVAIPIFLILIMVLSIFAILTNTNPTTPDDSGTDEIRFNSIVDGLVIVPPGADYVRFADLKSDEDIGNWAMANLNGSIPNPAAFGGQPEKDVLVNYPEGYFGSFAEQWVSITDFGPKYTITNPNQTSYNGVPMRAINSLYTYSETRPTVSGRIQNVADMLLYWSNPGNRTSYDNYFDLITQLKGYPVNATSARLSVVGTTSLLNASDRYYAGITPAAEEGKYDYLAVIHLNRTLNETEKQQYKSQYEQLGIYVMKFDAYNIKYQDDYMIVQAKGNLTTCVNDMTYSWRFLKA
ncbi:hypothetical protein [Methanocella sp. MCL-LM]|uniref:hypothetical protein n=1 Tax=Methanocella sp. MCL-LM TaxID=3412035 RepID=UPI003C76BC5D